MRLKLLAFSLILAFLAFAADTSDAVRKATLTITETSDSAQTNVVAPVPMSTQALTNGGFVASDTLDSEIEDASGTEIVFMPSPTQTQMEAYKQFDTTGSTWTTDTTDANSSAASDVTIFDADPEVGDAAYFGGHWPYRVLWLNIGTAGVGTWTITWEYCSDNSTGGAGTTCDAWTGVSNVADNTSGFTVSGTNVVSFDIADIQESTEDGVQSYWVRGRISAFTSSSTSPLGTQFWWDMGMWWTFNPSLSANQQVNYDLFTGFSAPRTFHRYFPGDAGITTTATMTLGGGTDAEIEIKGFFDATQTGGFRYLLDDNTNGSYIRWNNSTSGRLDAQLHTTLDNCNFTITGLSTTYYTVRASVVDADDCILEVFDANDVLVASDTDTYTGSFNFIGSPDISKEGSTFYLDSFKFTSGDGTLTHHYELNDAFTALVIPDRAGAAQDGVPSFPAIPSDVSTSTGSFTSTIDPFVASAATGAGIAVGAVSPNVGAFSGTGSNASSNLPGFDYLDDIETETNVPKEFYYLIFAAFSLVGVMVFVLLKLKSMIPVLALGLFVTALWIGSGVLEPWFAMWFVLVALALWWIDRRVSVSA